MIFLGIYLEQGFSFGKRSKVFQHAIKLIMNDFHLLMYVMSYSTELKNNLLVDACCSRENFYSTLISFYPEWKKIPVSCFKKVNFLYMILL